MPATNSPQARLAAPGHGFGGNMKVSYGVVALSGTITTALNAPILSGTQTSITFPAGLRIDTPITGGTGVIASLVL